MAKRRWCEQPSKRLKKDTTALPKAERRKEGMGNGVCEEGDSKLLITAFTKHFWRA